MSPKRSKVKAYTKKNCKSCLHQERGSMEEPCYTCFTGVVAYLKWEPKKEQKDGC